MTDDKARAQSSLLASEDVHFASADFMRKLKIILREAIADGTGHFPKGTIASRPEDKPLPPGMVWLRQRVRLATGMDEPVMWGDFTPEAKRIMAEAAGIKEDK